MFSFLRRARAATPGHTLYFAIVAQARQTALFESAYATPDTVDGRFDLLVLHAALVFRRLRALGPEATQLAEEAFEVMTADFDRSARELSAGDAGIAKRVKAMASGFYGRAQAYELAIDGTASLADALRRNLYGTVVVGEAAVEHMARYVRQAVAVLDAQSLSTLRAGEVGWPPPAA